MTTTFHSMLTERVGRTLCRSPFDFDTKKRRGRRVTGDLWLMVVIVSVADIVVTLHGLQVGFIEVNPIAQTGLVVFGAWSLIPLKGLALGVGVINCRILDRREYLVPATFILVWGSAVILNLALIVTHAY